MPTVSNEDEIREVNKQDKENFIQITLQINADDLEATEQVDREDKERLIRTIADSSKSLMVNDQITSTDLNLSEPCITMPLQLLRELNAMFKDITSNVLGKTTQESIVNSPELIDVDPDVPAGSDMEIIDYIEDDYIEDDYIGDMLPEESRSLLPQSVLDSLGCISPINVDSPPPQDDEFYQKYCKMTISQRL